MKKEKAVTAQQKQEKGNSGPAFPLDRDDAAQDFFAQPEKVKNISGITVRVVHVDAKLSLVVYNSENPVELVFGGEISGKRTAMLSDGTRVFIARTTEFFPLPGVKYLCSLKFRQKGKNVIAYAMPSLPYTLPVAVFPDQLTQLVQKVIFRQGDRGPVSTDKKTGKIILPQSKGEDAWDHEVKVGVEYTCNFREVDGCFIAEKLDIPVGTTQRALILGMAKKGKVDPERLKYLVWGGRYESIFSLLNRAFEKSGGKEGLLVDENSTKQEIERAFRACSKMFHPDVVLAGKTVSEKTRAGASNFFKATEQAKDQALDWIALRKEEKK